MNKSELVEKLAERAKITKKRAEQVVNAIFDAMTDAMRRDEGVEIRGFGTFTVRHYPSYRGRNPQTGDPVEVAPKRLPYFKVGKELRERINGERAPTEVARERPAAAPAAPSRPRTGGRSRDENVSEDVI